MTFCVLAARRFQMMLPHSDELMLDGLSVNCKQVDNQVTAPRERRWATRDEELKEKYILHYIEATDVLS